ncbi:MAG: gamma-glutamyl-gamma-aminobutyrate hydrolase family protein [Desulfobacteraceae bacterium]|nr:gamma-glutamyl-gamma-aminobutyrate hydrolase family protein [Desulfobacteraceae bacterium]
MKPLIAVIGHTDVNRFGSNTTSTPLAYTSSIEKAGGVPVIVPFTEDYSGLPAVADLVQGFLFPGGYDVDPDFYHEAPSSKLGKTDKALDRFQLAVLELAMEREKPLLAICRGTQLINVALGGTLFQDIPSRFESSTLKHMQETLTFDTDHSVEIDPGSRLHDLFGPRMEINSRHHQSIREPGKGLEITARAPDGVVEAAQHKTLPMDLVQWHPELMLQKNDAMLPLFQSFVEKCKNQ